MVTNLTKSRKMSLKLAMGKAANNLVHTAKPPKTKELMVSDPTRNKSGGGGKPKGLVEVPRRIVRALNTSSSSQSLNVYSLRR